MSSEKLPRFDEIYIQSTLNTIQFGWCLRKSAKLWSFQH